MFEPLLAEDGGLAGSVGSVIGTGSGRGVAFMFMVTGLMTAASGVVGDLMPRVRNIETGLPDDVTEATAA